MFISEILAISCAICIALSSMFINELNGRVPLLRLAKWQLTSALIMTAAAATVTGGWSTLGLWQVEMLLLSGISGIAIASTTYFAAIFTIGPRITSLLFSLSAPFAVLMGYIALDETITLQQGLGVGLIMAGIVVAIGLGRTQSAAEPPLNEQPAAVKISRPSLFGIALGVITAFGQAGGSLLARPAMATGVEPFAAMSVRLSLAVLFFWLAQFIAARRNTMPAFRWPDLGFAATASFFGTALGMSLLMAALKDGNVGLVTTLSSMTPIVILPMVWLKSGKRPDVNAWIGAAMAIAGTAMISLHF